MERITQLPNRPLVLGPEKMEFAAQEDGRIYLLIYTPRAGAPDDPTKREWDIDMQVLDAEGEVISPSVRNTTLTVLYDPSGAIQTPAEDTPAAQIMANNTKLWGDLKTWAAVILDPTPLYEQLAP